MNDHTRPSESPPTKQADVLHSVNWMSGAVAAILSVGMIADKHSVTVSVLSGVAFYGTVAGILVMTPLILNHQDNVTIRRRDELPYRYMPQHTPHIGLVDPVRLPEPAPLPQSPRFIPAVPYAKEGLKASAIGWVTQLFDPDTGEILPNKITRNKGQVQIKTPEAEVVEYLSSLGMVRIGEGKQLYWQSDPYSTFRYALNAIRTGVKPSSWQQGNRVGLTEVGESTL